MVDVVDPVVVEVVSQLVELVEVADADDHGDNTAFCPHTKLRPLRLLGMMVECIDANSAAII